MEKRRSVQKTAGRMIMDVLKKNYALSEDKAIGIEAFKNLPLTSQVIAYTIGNFIENGVIKEVDGKLFYFSQKDWDRLVKKVNFSYVLLYGLPLFFVFAYLLYTNWGNIMSFLS